MRHFSPSTQLTLTTHHKKHCKTSLQKLYVPLVHAKPINYFYSSLVVRNWFYSLPFQRLQALLTLFSKSFSPFPHGTFMLSVSSPYLALDEIYHPFALQSQGTRLVGRRPYMTVSQARTGLSPFLARFSKRLSPAPPLVQPLKTTIQGQVPDFHPELFPLQSPLLGES